MNLLVTGGAGYIGSVVADQLLKAGHEVAVFDNLSTGDERAVPEDARLVRGDLLDSETLNGVLAEGFDGVLHFAALSRVEESVEQPARYYRTNVCGTLNLLDAMRASKVPRLVFSSTAAVYGQSEEVPVRESAPTRPANPYGSSKLAVDRLIGYETAVGQLAAVSLRYFNVAGASRRFGGVYKPGVTQLIPIVLRVAAGHERTVRIYGTDYPTPDGTAIRDYIHVEDVARAHLLALEAAGPGSHKVYNLGNGSGYSVREVIETARRVTGRRIEIVEVPRRPGDPATVVAASDKIRSELGWKPEKPDLDTMIFDAWSRMCTEQAVSTEEPTNVL